MPKPSLSYARQIADREGIPLEEALQREVSEEHRFTIRVTHQPYSEHGHFAVYRAAIEGGESQTLFRRTMFDAAKRAVEGALRPLLPPEPWSGTIEFSISLHPDPTEEKGEGQ